jgi:hypothetical protein
MCTTNFKLLSQIKENSINYVILLKSINFSCEWTLSLLTQGFKKPNLHHWLPDLFSSAEYTDHCVKHSLIVIRIILLILCYNPLFVTKFNNWYVNKYNN